MVKVAIIGLGKVVDEIHMPACRMIDEIEVVAGCDPDEARRKMMGERYSLAATYPDAQTMLAAESPELVLVCTPPQTHKDMCLLALHHGAHVLCEKPFAATIEEADEMIAAAESQNRLLAVNNQYRYMDIYSRVREQLAGGDYGRLYYLQGWQQMFHPPANDKTLWRSQLKQATLFEFGTHPLDLICNFFDALPTAVNAVMPQVSQTYENDVLIQMTLYFPDERLATLSLNRVSHAPERYLEMRLDCEEASVRISMGGVARASLAMNRYQGTLRPTARFSFVRGGEARVEVGSRSSLIAKEAQDARPAATARHLKSLLPQMQQPTPSLQAARHARAILQIVFKAYESAQRREIIEL
jgi:predicted dehydrogenase